MAAKLSDIRNGTYHTYITAAVFKNMLDSSKYSTGAEQKLMWEGPYTREVGGETLTVYKSSWTWAL
ncbi:hypothetical protein KBP30_14425 [Streptomyces sp. Go40/10]|uniref:hypothetical protein n=1 Tax=Streptomyces sp. Go40/10 TaxID=2825844 RepID=UPI001E5BDDB9|nr:hypothetical protein [Streptomyces sp. Go40/10]UFR02308.1 hypothetical protein KBP30_14425 [Streptomyces sp. Go40/10]